MVEKVAARFLRATFDEVLEALIAHANHNKRLPLKVVGQIKTLLDQHPLLVSPAAPKVYRGDVATAKSFAKDVGLTLPERGSKSVTLHLEPGSSWSTDIDQAKYHATSGTLSGGIEVLYTTHTSRGSWLDMRELYKLPQLRGLRGEREVIGLDAQVQCLVEWVTVPAQG